MRDPTCKVKVLLLLSMMLKSKMSERMKIWNRDACSVSDSLFFLFFFFSQIHYCENLHDIFVLLVHGAFSGFFILVSR